MGGCPNGSVPEGRWASRALAGSSGRRSSSRGRRQGRGHGSCSRSSCYSSGRAWPQARRVGAGRRARPGRGPSMVSVREGVAGERMGAECPRRPRPAWCGEEEKMGPHWGFVGTGQWARGGGRQRGGVRVAGDECGEATGSMARRRNGGLGTGRGGGRGTRGDGGVGGDLRQRWSATGSPGGGGIEAVSTGALPI
nr:translation initiation factor IF-2-like [Aegilops tauschii subsp. strangulata]